jgi:hypothetical protein
MKILLVFVLFMCMILFVTILHLQMYKDKEPRWTMCLYDGVTEMTGVGCSVCDNGEVSCSWGGAGQSINFVWTPGKERTEAELVKMFEDRRRLSIMLSAWYMARAFVANCPADN